MSSRPGPYVGRPILRVEDPALLRGRARFVDDIASEATLHAAIIRSRVAHASLLHVELDAARAMPGVIAVLGPADVAAATRDIHCAWVLPNQRQATFPVVDTDIRYVGQPLGIVVARTAAIAYDALDTIEIEYSELPAVVDVEAAASGSPALLYPEWGTNVVVELLVGSTPAEIDAQIAQADHVISDTFRVQRQAGAPMEPRGVLADFDRGTGELTVWSSTQVPHHIRQDVAEVLGLRVDRVRVIAPSVGGGFGPKDHLYTDEVLVCLASLELGRPVKWVEQRTEHLQSTVHCRDQVHQARLAFDSAGRFLAIDTHLLVDLGARCSNVGAGPAFSTAALLEGPYHFGAAAASVRGIVTNKTPSGAYRGFGQPEAAWVRERLIDEAARKLSMSPVEIRRRNMITADEMPFVTHSGQSYDSGDYAAALLRATEMISQTQPTIADHRRRGTGVASYVQFAGSSRHVSQNLNFKMPGYETVVLRMEADAGVTLHTGVCPHGQGLETTLAQVAADHLGLPMEQIHVVVGDTATTPYSAGTIASRSMMMGGAAVTIAAQRLRQRLLDIAAFRLEAAVEDLDIVDGKVEVRGTPTAHVVLTDLARDAWLGWNLPPDADVGLEERATFDPDDCVYSYATHAVQIAVDVETGAIEVERYVVVQDCGTIVNPLVVEGQIHGAVAQGIGGALLERLTYDENGQLVTSSFLDYLIPSACEIPNIEIEHIVIPTPRIPGGMKGMAEGGLVPSAAAIGNALAAAVPEIAHRVTETPLDPLHVWTWLRDEHVTDTSPHPS